MLQVWHCQTEQAHPPCGNSEAILPAEAMVFLSDRTCIYTAYRCHGTVYCTISTDRSHHASQGPVNILKIGIAGMKKILGALRQFYEQFGQKIHSVTHHHWS